MTSRLGAALACLLALVVPTLAQEPPKGDVTPTGYTRVAGNELPDWRVWRAAFRGLARPNEPGKGEGNWLPGSIDVPPDQLALILKTATRSAAAEAEMVMRQQETLAAMQAADKPWKDIKPVLYELDYAQRVTTLRERDALLEQLSPDARLAFENWIQLGRNGAESFVPTSDLENWRRPS